MLIRILSDLHLDINRDYNVELENNYLYTLIAGDLGGDYRGNAEWLKKNVHEGAFISGNHDAYTDDQAPLEDVKEFYHKEFPENAPVTYMDNDVGVITKDLGDNILLIADVLYTDYKLRADSYHNGMKIKQVIESNMHRATPKMSGSYLNDFHFYTRNGMYEKSEYEIKYDRCPKGCFFLRPENYKKHFDETFKKITKIVEDNPDKDIILMTHHCLSKKCISREYVNDTLNASYVSNKDSWIKKHPNIKLIVSGHVHHRASFKVGSTLYVMNPLGYLRNAQNRQYDEKLKKYTFWSPSCIVDTKDWSLRYEPYENKEWDKIQEEHAKRMLAYASIFM